MQFIAVHEETHRPWLVAIIFFIVAACFISLYLSKDQNSNAVMPLSVQYIADYENRLSLEDIRNTPMSDFLSADTTVNLGMAKYAHWFRVELPTTNRERKLSLFEIHYPLLDNINIWLFADNNAPEPLYEIRLGDAINFFERPVQHESFIINMPDGAKNTVIAIIRAETQGSIKLPMRLWESDHFVEHTSNTHLVAGVLFGLLLAMAISNLFFFVTTGNNTFSVYAGYVTFLWLTLFTLHGYGFEYLWPDSIWFQERAIAIFANATIMFTMFFSDQLLNLKKHHLRVSQFVNGLGWLFFLNVIISLFAPYYYMLQFYLVLLVLVVIAVFAICVWLSAKGVIIARYYTLAWSVLLIGALASSLDNLNVIQLPISGSTMLLYGAVAETLLLALVLALSYGSQQSELVAAQDLTIEKEKQIAAAKDKLLAVEQEAKDDLEYKVQERTLELEITLRELSEANRELERLNTIDPLTGIRNRRHFDKRIVAEGRRSRREQTTLALVMMDIDHFKQVNDKFGHDTGDQCIIHIAQLAKSFIKRPSDDICRYGGEEFAFILPNTSLQGASQLIERIRMSIESSPLTFGGEVIPVTISAGIASQVIQWENGETNLLKEADKALYLAKEQGRNRVITAVEN